MSINLKKERNKDNGNLTINESYVKYESREDIELSNFSYFVIGWSVFGIVGTVCMLTIYM